MRNCCSCFIRKLHRFSVFILLIALSNKWLFTLSSSNFNKNSNGLGHPSSTRTVTEDNDMSYKISKTNPRDSKSQRQEREQLYGAYNLLHKLAQDFRKPFDAPAVIVIGHQTSGKSALIEALMGFQFNQVGGGTKTRRPIALRMQFNPSCTSPLCFLTMENGKEEQKSLTEIQDYIENENKRLERDPTRYFDPREINIRMEYRYCPNMMVIDTPGMLHAPKGRQLTPQQTALARAAREAEQLVLSKIRCQDYIILCVEDTADWKHATTRNIVTQVDPDLTRTVLVCTKLDTKLPQFSEAEDLDDFLNAPLIMKLFPHILGGPYFTSVPSGRVGMSKDFDSNEAFVRRLRSTEVSDRRRIIDSMGSKQAKPPLEKVGITKLRSFLEARVEDCYRRNVAKIVPLLQTDLHNAESKLDSIENEIKDLSIDRLKARANIYREKFCKELASLIQGTVKASPEDWGETLDMEQLRGGVFLDQDQSQTQVWQNILEVDVGNVKHRLFGGAQYHRALREFTMAVRHAKAQLVTEDEIANAAGVGDVHNGVNFMRAAAVIAMEKAQQSFEPMLETLRHRATYIMRRLFPIVDQIIRSEANGITLEGYSKPFQDMVRRVYEKFVQIQMEDCIVKCKDDLRGMTRFVTWDVDGKGGSSALYRSLPTPKHIVEIYKVAVEGRTQKTMDAALKARESNFDDIGKQQDSNSREKQSRDGRGFSDLKNVGNNGRTPKSVSNNNANMNRNGKDKSPADKIFDEWSSASGQKSEESNRNSNDRNQNKNSHVDNSNVGKGRGSTPNYNNLNQGDQVNESTERRLRSDPSSHVVSNEQKTQEENAEVSDYYDMLQLMEEMLAGRNANRTSVVVTALVQYIVRCWRDHFARTVAMKLNCFFLMPFLDDFPAFLRTELDKMYDSDVAELFDIREARQALLNKREELIAESEANRRTQREFDLIKSQLSSVVSAGSSKQAVSSMRDDDEEDEAEIEEDEEEDRSIFDSKESSVSKSGNNDRKINIDSTLDTRSWGSSDLNNYDTDDELSSAKEMEHDIDGGGGSTLLSLKKYTELSSNRKNGPVKKKGLVTKKSPKMNSNGKENNSTTKANSRFSWSENPDAIDKNDGDNKKRK